MVSVIESEKLGLGLDLIEALNDLALFKAPSRKSYTSRIWITLKVKKVVELMDEVIC